MKIGATRVDHDVKLAVAAGADVVVVDGMQGGTAATQDVFIEHAGIPTLPAVRMAAEALREIGVARRGAARSSRAASAPAPTWPRPWPSAPTPSPSAWPPCWPWAATGRPTATHDGSTVDVSADYAALGTAPGRCAHCHTGSLSRSASPPRTPRSRRGSIPSAPPPRWPTTYARLTMEVTALARACGKSAVHHLEPEDLAALTVEAAAMARVPLAGTGWIPGWPILSAVTVTPHGRGGGDRWRRGGPQHGPRPRRARA